MNIKAQNKTCQNCNKDFTIESEDFNFYEKIKVPPSTWCPRCRAMRRLMWRNERSLYRNTCTYSHKPIISMFTPESGLTVYERDVWWGDEWNPTDYGQEYDFSRPFFQQYKELMQKVPLANVGNTNNISSEYCNHSVDCKNCYLTYASMENENVAYTQGAVGVKDSFDLYTVMKSEKCYDDVICSGLFATHFSYDSDDSINCYFLTSCINLQDCLACVNLRHKSHCIFNQQYTKEEYEKKLASHDFGSYKSLTNFKQEFNNFVKKQPRRFANIFKSVNVTGDNLMSSKNSKMIFDVYGNVEDSKYGTHLLDLKDGYDGYGMGDKGESLYEGVDLATDSARNSFGILNHSCLDTNYTYMCYSSMNLFGCIGLRKQEYCILNKKYSKEEYKKLVPKIIEHINNMPYIDKRGRVYKYGEFFPTDLSPFAYNETIAGEYYPLTEAQAKEYDFKWKGKTDRNYKIEVRTADLPDHIKNVSDSLVGKVIECMHVGACNEQCTEAFKIRQDELEFLRRNNIALPRLCPNCRHYERLRKRNPLNLWHRACMCDKVNHSHEGKCPNEFETSYAPERPEIIYCEKCYQQEVY